MDKMLAAKVFSSSESVRLRDQNSHHDEAFNEMHSSSFLPDPSDETQHICQSN